MIPTASQKRTHVKKKELDELNTLVALALQPHLSLNVLQHGPPHALIALLHGSQLTGLLGAADNLGLDSQMVLIGAMVPMRQLHGEVLAHVGERQEGSTGLSPTTVLCAL